MKVRCVYMSVKLLNCHWLFNSYCFAFLEDIQLLVSQQFKAKSKELAGLSAHGLVNGDQKVFSFKADKFLGDIAFAVVETTDDAVIIDRLDELLPEMVACKVSNLDMPYGECWHCKFGLICLTLFIALDGERSGCTFPGSSQYCYPQIQSSPVRSN